MFAIVRPVLVVLSRLELELARLRRLLWLCLQRLVSSFTRRIWLFALLFGVGSLSRLKSFLFLVVLELRFGKGVRVVF